MSSDGAGGAVRVIAGRYRGRKLCFPGHSGLRPTGDRIRETLFNWLAPVITGARCLDLFAGSGALGFEAASRGAAEVVMVEQAPRVMRSLRENSERLDLKEVTLVQADALSWLNQSPDPFDVVFLDPPFAQDLLGACCELLASGGWLRSGACVYLEAAGTPGLPELAEGWSWLHRKRAGRVAYGLARYAPRTLLAAEAG